MKFLLAVFVFVYSQTAQAESVLFENHTQKPVSVWIKEGDAKEYRMLTQFMWNNKRPIRFNVNQMPFKLAVSATRATSFTYLGPYNFDSTDQKQPRVEILEKQVFETKTKEVQYWAGNAWKVRTYNYTVGRYVPETRTEGLKQADETGSTAPTGQ